MGLDLSLLPFDERAFFSHSILECFRRRDLFDVIINLEEERGRETPSDFRSYMSRDGDVDPHYGATTETPYGNRLKFLVASDLKPLANHVDVRDNPVNRAVWAYLAELPDNYCVALMWG